MLPGLVHGAAAAGDVLPCDRFAYLINFPGE